MDSGDGKSEDGKLGLIFFLVGLAIALFLLAHFRIIRSDKSRLFIFTLSNSSAWTLHPKTIRIEGSNIRIPIFTPVFHDYGRLENIALRKPLRDDLYFYGARLGDTVSSIALTPLGGIVGLFTAGGGQPLVMDGRWLMFKTYRKEYKYGDDEYEIVVSEYFALLDFDPIMLEDGTVITVNDIGPECVLKMAATEWRLYIQVDTASFLLKNAQSKEEKLVHSITFEPHFGKMLEYRLTEPERYFGDGRF
jgi:hypothetical protein